MNRSVFEANQKINHGVVYPVADAFRENVPEPVRDSLDAFTGNLGEPFVFANNLLQFRLNAAAITVSRFVVNSTLGIGGLFDVAGNGGAPRQTGDFGQTLYVWGVRDSEFLMLPVVGPTNVRDAIGNGVELAAQFFVGPIIPTKAATAANYAGTAGTVATPVSSLSKVEQMQELERSSLDFYSMMRSVVEQKRQVELRDALKESPLSQLPWFAPDWQDEPTSPMLSSLALEASPAIQPSPASKPLPGTHALPETPVAPETSVLKLAPAPVGSRPFAPRTVAQEVVP
jgi:phospholipid-binding lipoprotein MlaA